MVVLCPVKVDNYYMGEVREVTPEMRYTRDFEGNKVYPKGL
jgi:hypothetical protein